MNIRQATMADAEAIWQLRQQSILSLCHADYTQEELAAWIALSPLERQQVSLQKHRTFIAEQNGEMIGYVRWSPATNELCSIFVDPDHVRQGVATTLMATACADAIDQGVSAFWLDASLTAVPFYKADGWTILKPMAHGALDLACVRMTKVLQP